jgi:hypothetical protein
MKIQYILPVVLLASFASAWYCVTLYNPLPLGESRMRVAFPYNLIPEKIDPANITLAPEYFFLEQVLSPLIEMDIHGTVTSGVASRFEWIGDEAVLTIRNDLVTIDGYQITAEDVGLSLKRLLVLSGNTHGNLQELLCHGNALTSITDSCAGLEVRGNQIILKPGRRAPFLFPMLAAIDFAVIPARSFDQKTLRITDYRNTSGPYYVSADAGNGRVTLSANPKHYHYSDRMPKEFTFVPMDKTKPNDSLEALSKGDVDVITTADAATPEAVLQFHKKHANQFTLHRTQDIRNILVAYSERGQQSFSSEQRRCLGRKIREAFTAQTANSLAYKTGVQFLPIFGEGGLSKDQLSQLAQSFQDASDCPKSGEGYTATLVRLALHDEFQNILTSILPGLILENGQNPAFIDYSSKPNEMPILAIPGPDTGFLEDIGLISYSMNSGFFSIPKKDRGAWLGAYGKLEKKEDRIALLNKLHFDSLMDPVIVPLAMAPYVALLPKDWDPGLSTLFANCQLWLFRRK